MKDKKKPMFVYETKDIQNNKSYFYRNRTKNEHGDLEKDFTIYALITVST